MPLPDVHQQTVGLRFWAARALRRTALACLALAPWVGHAQSVIYNNGDNNASALTTPGGINLTVASGTATQSGAITGAGGITKLGAGTLILAGRRGFFGTAYVSAGTLQFGNFASPPAVDQPAPIDVAAGAFAAFLSYSDNGNMYNSISGAGTFVKVNTADIYAYGDITTANTVIADGTLYLFGTLSGHVINDGRLAFARQDINVFSGTISGTGELSTLEGHAKLVFTGTNTSSGVTTNDGTLEIGAGGTSGFITGDIVNHGSLLFDRSDAHTYAGSISGDGSVTFRGSGTLALTGAHTYTGGTTIALGGHLQIGDGGTSGSVAGDITDNYVLTFNRSDDITDGGGLISGNGILIKEGAGTLTLTRNHTYNGTWSPVLGVHTLVSAGTLQLGDGVTSGGWVNGNITNNAALVFNRGADNLTFSPVISGSGTLAKLGSGTIALTGNHTFTGLTTVSAGTLSLGAGGLSGSLADDIVTNAALVFNRSDDVVYAGAISGTGSVTKLGAGTLTLTGAATHAGGTTITAGLLQVGNGGSSGSLAGNVANAAALAFNRSDDLTFSGAISGAGSVTKLGADTLTLTGTNTFTGDLTLAAGALQLGNSGTALADNGAVILTDGTLRLGAANETIGRLSGTGGTIDLGSSRTLTANQSTDGTFAGIIAGTGGTFAKSGAGTLTLTGNDSTSTGTTVISAGTLQLGDGGTSGWLAGGITNNAALVFNRSDDVTFAPAISGSGSVTQSGPGTLTLAGNNAYSGPTTVTSGWLAFDSAGRLGSGTITLNGGGLRWLGNSADLSARLTAIGAAGTTLDTNGNDVAFASALSGSGAITKIGAGTLMLQGNNASFSGALGITSGTLEFATLANLGSGTLTADGATLRWAAGGTADISGRLAALGENGVTFDTNGNNVTLASALTGNGALVKSGAGTLTLDAASTRAGDTTVSAGALRLGHALALQNSAVTLSVHDGLDLNGHSATIASLAGTGNLSLGAGTLALGSNNASTTYAGVLSGAGALVKNGTGTFTLNGTSANSFSGGATLNAGTVVIPALDRLGSGTLTLAGGTLRWADGTASDSATNAFVFGSGGGLLDTNGASVAVSGAFSGSGAFTKAGDGTLTLSGNFAPGSTTVSGGTLRLADGGATIAPGDVSLAAGTTIDFARSAAIGYAGVVTGTGLLHHTGSGTLTLSGNSSAFAGTTRVTGTTLQVTGALATSGLQLASASVTGNGNLTVGSGGLQVSGQSTISAPLELSGASHAWSLASGATLTIDGNLTSTASAPPVISGSVDSTVNLQPANSFGGTVAVQGDVTLSLGANFTGALRLDFGESVGMRVRSADTTARSFVNWTIQSPTVRFGDTDPGRNGALTLQETTLQKFQSGGANNYTFQVDSSLTLDTVSGSNFGGPGGATPRLIKTGSGTLTLEGFTPFTGITVNAGTLATTNASGFALGSGTLTLNCGTFRPLATFSLNRATVLGAASGTFDTPAAVTLTWNGAINGSGALTKIGGGTLVLGGSNGYTGGTTVSGGTLALVATGSLANTPSITVGDGAFFDVSAAADFTLGSGQTLGGTGSITGPLALGAGAHLAPGSSPGTLMFTGGLTLNTGAILDFQLGTVSDLINVTGGTLTGPASPGGVTLNLSNAGGFGPGTYTLINYATASGTSQFGADRFTLGSSVAGYTYAFTDTGSTLELTATAAAIPEPGTCALLAGMLMLAACLIRRPLAAP